MRRLLCTMMVMALAGSSAWAQTERSSLQSMEQDVQALYQGMQQCVVRVQVPLQVSKLAAERHPITKWGPQLDPKVREQIEQPQGGEPVRVFVERPLTGQGRQLDLQGGPTAILITPRTAVIMADFLGLVIDTEGHVLLPLFVDRELVGDASLRVMHGERQVTTARLLGADRQTNLAVVKLAQPVGTPVKMASAVPAHGSLVLLMSPVRRSTRLTVWTGGHDEHAVVIASDGTIAGFNRYGHMLEPWTFRPMVDQLIQTGTVERAVLGVLIHEVRADDPARMYIPALGTRPAARVVEVGKGSAAEAAGLLVGDLLLELGGEPVNDLPHFAAALARHRDDTELLILRGEAEKTLIVNLQPR